MKIAVSLPDDLFEQADALAAEQGVSRSHVYAQALREYLENHAAGNDPVTARLNELADLAEPGVGADTARHLIDSGQWEW